LGGFRKTTASDEHKHGECSALGKDTNKGDRKSFANALHLSYIGITRWINMRKWLRHKTDTTTFRKPVFQWGPPVLFRNERDLVDGFTLIELMVTILIMGVLASISIPAYNGYIETAKTTKAIGDLYTLEKEIIAYGLSNNEYPENLGDIDRDGFLDPWGNPYQYLNIETAKGKGKMRKDHFLVPLNTDFDLYSMGSDGSSQSPLTAKASHDDILRANNGSYVGRAANY